MGLSTGTLGNEYTEHLALGKLAAEIDIIGQGAVLQSLQTSAEPEKGLPAGVVGCVLKRIIHDYAKLQKLSEMRKLGVKKRQ